MVKLRLKRLGRKMRPFYRIVAMPVTAPRDGKPLEELGYYDPVHAELTVDAEAAIGWLNRGAQMTATVRNLLKNQGVLAQWRGTEGIVREGALLADKPKRRKKLAATGKVEPTPEASTPEPGAPEAAAPEAAAPAAEGAEASEAAPEAAAPPPPAAEADAQPETEK